MDIVVSDISFFVEGIVSFVGAVVLLIAVGKLGQKTLKFLKENASFKEIKDFDLKK